MPVISVGDLSVAEGDSGTTNISATVSLNVKSASTITARVTHACAGTGHRPRASTTSRHQQAAHVQAGQPEQEGHRHDHQRPDDRGRRDVRPRAVEPRERVPGHTPATVTILDNDNPLPTAPSGLTAATSHSTLGGVELSWTAATVPLVGLADHHVRVPRVDRRRRHLRAVDRHGRRHVDLLRAVVRPGRHAAPTRSAALNKKGASAAAPQTAVRDRARRHCARPR